MRTATVDRRAYSRRFWEGKTRFSQAVRRTLEELERQKGQTKKDEDGMTDIESSKKRLSGVWG
ncbi:hypothetical protein AD954_11000 [Acetobacter cerevisiae]|uniref:Uncharacterized protein n=1 Tax=Acetobacter cerevisiae TaxID=178900 RepID=A0A149V920_9PROT|nr:hypothetical protein AD954_11000 [Acetobacter cerevisiae]